MENTVNIDIDIVINNWLAEAYDLKPTIEILGLTPEYCGKRPPEQ